MVILSRDKEALTFQQIKEGMAQRIYELAESDKGKFYSKKIIRVEIPCPDIDCLGWCKRQLSENKIYWSDRNGEFETAGVGIADVVKGDATADYGELFSALRRGLSLQDKYLRYYGGVGFYNKGPGREWEPFGSYFFIVPQFEILKVKGKTFFACNITADTINPSAEFPRFQPGDECNAASGGNPGTENGAARKIVTKKKGAPDFSPGGSTLSGITMSLSKLNGLIFSDERLSETIPRVSALRHSPDRHSWEKIFNEKIRVSGNMIFDKIVLARKTCIDFERDINPLVLFSHLKEHTKNCFHYYFQPSIGAAFLGASPERLFTRRGLQVESEAIAGTKPCGKSGGEDVFYQQELFSSAKEALEHRYVVDGIRNTLNKFCALLQCDETRSVLKVTTVQHLITRFKGRLKEKTGDAQLLSALHPTAAVGGYPTDKALSALSKIEPFCRGWYAGPVGFVGYDDVDFAVAIRCALVGEKKVSLFAGAGIVEGSTPEDEWQEIENKNSVYMRIFEEQPERS